MKKLNISSPFALAAALLVSGTAVAAPKLRVQVDQKGDFILIGNTLGHDCRGFVPAPVVGTLGACGNNTGDSAPDVYWRADDPAAGQAVANNTVAMAQARSTATLALKSGASVTHAYLYWGARRTGTTADTSVTVERQGGFTQTVNATANYTVDAGGGQIYYQSVADVTDLVKTNGSGGYRVSGVDGLSFINLDANVNFAGWYMVVLYQDATEAPRNLAVFDGLDLVTAATDQNATLSGFLVPAAGFDAKLGVITFEGDPDSTGDSLSVRQGAAEQRRPAHGRGQPHRQLLQQLPVAAGRAGVGGRRFAPADGRLGQHVQLRSGRGRHHQSGHGRSDLGGHPRHQQR
jgi:hypothetical protein